PGLSFNLSGHLLDFDDDEFGRLEWREADHDVDNAQVNVVLSRGFLIALHEVSVARGHALERALAEKPVHECADVEPNLRPQWLVVGLEDDPLSAAIEALLDEQRRAPHGNVLPLGGEAIGSLQSP